MLCAIFRGTGMEATKPGADEMYCSSCGSIIKKRAEICVKCGVRVTGGVASGAGAVAIASPSPKSRVAAGILGILLGSIGIHRFYLGSIGIGIAQILVSLVTFGIGGLWGFIEGIIILANGDWKDSQGRALPKYGM